jgi:hypothetical protein
MKIQKHTELEVCKKAQYAAMELFQVFCFNGYGTELGLS